ncbi:amino acid ABC transporter substrate-binding protein [Streptomyces sp. AJS327]|nr:amino acid ABC transporter substrate-binding protein [Streptomyces sp. AJS327]
MVLGLALIAGLVTAITVWRSDDTEECRHDLQRVEGACMALAQGDFAYAPEIKELVRAVARENASVEDSDEPVRRIALTMPFSSDETSAMPLDLIRNGLAGALAGQRAANKGPGPDYQLLLADIGRGMKQWRPVTDQLVRMSDTRSPLIATIGLPSSTDDSRDAMRALARKAIPSVGPVITSSDMHSKEYFFKTSPSNTHFSEALKEYLADNPGKGKGYLVFDRRDEDTYARDLEEKLRDAFGRKYDLDTNFADFAGTRGEEAGTPRLFKMPVLNICAAEADTVFYAGRDEDLPALIKGLAATPRCGYQKPLRVLKVGIGLPPELTTKDLTDRMERADIRIVNAASVDPSWARAKDTRKSGELPTGFAEFEEQFTALAKRQKMGSKPLDDGYAIMYYDAFRAVSEASGLAYEDVGSAELEKAEQDQETPDENASAAAERVREDVYHKLLNLKPNRRGGADGCSPCVEGASGTYGFNIPTSKTLWPVCKAVHIQEHPVPTKRREGEDGPPEKPYRTYADEFSGECPSGL